MRAADTTHTLILTLDLERDIYRAFDVLELIIEWKLKISSTLSAALQPTTEQMLHITRAARPDAK